MDATETVLLVKEYGGVVATTLNEHAQREEPLCAPGIHGDTKGVFTIITFKIFRERSGGYCLLETGQLKTLRLFMAC